MGEIQSLTHIHNSDHDLLWGKKNKSRCIKTVYDDFCNSNMIFPWNSRVRDMDHKFNDNFYVYGECLTMQYPLKIISVAWKRSLIHCVCSVTMLMKQIATFPSAALFVSNIWSGLLIYAELPDQCPTLKWQNLHVNIRKINLRAHVYQSLVRKLLMAVRSGRIGGFLKGSASLVQNLCTLSWLIWSML